MQMYDQTILINETEIREARIGVVCDLAIKRNFGFETLFPRVRIKKISNDQWALSGGVTIDQSEVSAPLIVVSDGNPVKLTVRK